MNTPHPELAFLYGLHFETLMTRFERALSAAGYEGVLIHSGTPPCVFQDDQSYPFRANAYFKLWAALTDVPDSFIYVKPGQPPLLVFHRPTDYWHKPAQLPQSYWTARFEIKPVSDLTAARAALPTDLSRVAYIGESFEGLANWGLEALNPKTLLNRLDYTRAIKTGYELECLRGASRLAVRGHTAAARAFQAGASEFEIQLEYLRACGQREIELPYNAIIALNAGGAVLHYQVLERTAPMVRYSLLIDSGAEFAGYASDITRTYAYTGASDHGANRFPTSNPVTAEFAALITRMDEVQQSLCSSVRAGVDWRDIHLSAHRHVAELLQDADIISCDIDEAVDTGLSSVFLPHGIGHLLGLQVHDVGGLMRSAEGGEIPRPEGHPHLRLTRVLEPGFVVTMEPGIYFIPQLLEAARAESYGRHINWSRVEGLRKFGGIRIEDDLAVTATGCENLTRDAFGT